MNNSARLVKNTLYLYGRLIITTVITLFATRIILKNLGIIDYGIYQVVAGVIMLFSFLNNSMTSSTQRYLSFGMAKGEIENVKETFNVSLHLHMLIAVFVVLIGETIGLWFVKNTLSIPEERIEAAIYVYHCVIIIFSVNILSVPYQALVNAKEDFHVIALQGITESIAKLGIAYGIVLISFDRLKSYGILLLILAIGVALIYYIYSVKKYPECKLRFKTCGKHMYLELSSFAGWTIFGAMASLVKRQGTTIVLNIFLGPTANAAFGVAGQVGNQIGVISSIVLKAVNPQIVKSFGSNNLREMFKYLIAASKFTFYLFAIIAIPLFFEAKFILDLWLVNVPEYALIFTKLLLVNALIEVLIGPLITGIQATARIKYYQLLSGLTFLLNIPVMYLVLYWGFAPSTVLFSNIFFTAFVGFIRLYFLKKLVTFSISIWINEVLLKCLTIIAIGCIAALPLLVYTPPGWTRLMLITATNIIAIPIAIYLLGLKKEEKMLIKEIISKKLKKQKAL